MGDQSRFDQQRIAAAMVEKIRKRQQMLKRKKEQLKLWTKM